MLQDRVGLDVEAEESVHFIVDDAKRMINLENELLQYTTAAKDKDALSFVDTSALVQGIMVSLTSTIKLSRATVNCTALPTVL